MTDPKEQKRTDPASKRNNAIKAILVVILVAAIIAVGVAILRQLELARDLSPDGAGTAVSRGSISERDMEIVEDLGLDLTAEDEYPVLEEEETDTLFYNGQLYKFNDSLKTLLIMGIDDYGVERRASYRNRSQADFLLMVVFDPEGDSCRIIQIDRNTMADVPVLGYFGNYLGTTEEQITMAHTYGHGVEDSCENTVLAVSILFYYLPIDNYIALTMDAIPILTDLAGGVTVTIEDDFTGVDDSLVMGETVTLDSSNAETFVRARMYMQDDDTNIARMRRQRDFMTDLAAKLGQRASSDASFAMDAYGQLADYIVTDCTVDELSAYSEQLGRYDLSDIVVPEGVDTSDGTYEQFWIDEDALQALIIDTFYLPVEE